MRKRIVSKVFPILFLSPQALWAAECEPSLDSNRILDLVNNRNSRDLVAELINSAGPSNLFIESQGTEGIKDAVEEMVAKMMETRTASSDPLSASDAQGLVDQFEEGIAAACDALASGNSNEEAAKVAIKAAELSGGDSTFYLLLGTANSLEGDGSFSSGLEASFQSVTEFRGRSLGIHKIPLLGNTYRKNPDKPVAGRFEVTFSEIGSIDEENDPSTDPMNPFAAGGGFFRLDTSLDTYFSDSNAISGFGFRLGGGFSTQPSEAQNDVGTRGRGYAGVVFRANYGKDDRGRQGKGELFLGVAKDKFWRYETMPVSGDPMDPPTIIDETDRFVVDARMDIPQVFSSEDIRMHGRIFADLPTSGKGPSDIRISLLLTVNLGAFFPMN